MKTSRAGLAKTGFPIPTPEIEKYGKAYCGTSAARSVLRSPRVASDAARERSTRLLSENRSTK
ncbi:MAG: hypothetical protein A2W25_10435 [candidate division Zixibacteria bacterium RBG_16_53_22]|nr:MAG: hypothetical protein A2W25_10435 [candidate division Zixibacteria bacterium RBG_16_53_22]